MAANVLQSLLNLSRVDATARWCFSQKTLSGMCLLVSRKNGLTQAELLFVKISEFLSHL